MPKENRVHERSSGIHSCDRCGNTPLGRPGGGPVGRSFVAGLGSWLARLESCKPNRTVHARRAEAAERCARPKTGALGRDQPTARKRPQGCNAEIKRDSV